MSATAKIDFEPDLFGDEQPADPSNSHTTPPKPRSNRAPFIVAGGLLLVLVAVLVAVGSTDSPRATPTTLTTGPQTAMPILPLSKESQPIFTGSAVPQQGFCVGFETMCSASTTTSPSETLTKLAAALPREHNAKRYQVKVSVVSLDE